MNETCEWCGRALKKPRYFFDGFGVQGRGWFCTKTCGWAWAVRHLDNKLGQRIYARVADAKQEKP